MALQPNYTAARYFGFWARNNAWANHRLIDSCTRLNEAEFTAPRTGFFPSIMLTLNHNLIVDRFYVDALEGGDLGYAAFDDRAPCPVVDDLARAQASVDQRLVDVCDALSDEALGHLVHVRRPDRVQVERADRLLMHLFQHQIHHRGQAHAMLSGTPIEPPQLDEFFSDEESALRRDDFATLGWDEAEIWRSGAAVSAVKGSR